MSWSASSASDPAALLLQQSSSTVHATKEPRPIKIQSPITNMALASLVDILIVVYVVVVPTSVGCAHMTGMVVATMIADKE